MALTLGSSRADKLCESAQNTFNRSVTLDRLPQLWKTSCLTRAKKPQLKELSCYRMNPCWRECGSLTSPTGVLIHGPSAVCLQSCIREEDGSAYISLWCLSNPIAEWNRCDLFFQLSFFFKLFFPNLPTFGDSWRTVDFMRICITFPFSLLTFFFFSVTSTCTGPWNSNWPITQLLAVMSDQETWWLLGPSVDLWVPACHRCSLSIKTAQGLSNSNY